MKIKQEIADILSDATIDGNKLYLEGNLDRKTYLEVSKVLESIGGKWSRKDKATVFNKDIEQIISDIILTGEYTDIKKDFQFFETPDELAKSIVERACIEKDDICLEPSAGKGNIAKYIPGCDCIEMNPDNRKYLEDNGFKVIHDDFMTFEPAKDYDVIVMNPPFSKHQDIKHVTKAIDVAKKTVVAVMSASVLFSNDKVTKDFRNLVESFNGTIECLPDNSFKSSGTSVKTVLVIIKK